MCTMADREWTGAVDRVLDDGEEEIEEKAAIILPLYARNKGRFLCRDRR